MSVPIDWQERAEQAARKSQHPGEPDAECGDDRCRITRANFAAGYLVGAREMQRAAVEAFHSQMFVPLDVEYIVAYTKAIAIVEGLMGEAK